MWVFTRVSGLILILLAIIGLVLAFWMGARTQMDMATILRWTFFPNSYHVVNSDIPDVVPGWANAYWQIMQILIISFAGTHGVNGVRVVLEDYMGHTRWRVFWRGLLFLLWAFMMGLAFFIILTI
jgi:succinate dehydrogenase hydrophobic anchor subunit